MAREVKTPLDFEELGADPATPPSGRLRAYAKDGELWVKDDTGSAFSLSDAPGAIMVPKTADESVALSTTPQDDDHLVLAVGANETWLIEFLLIWTEMAGGSGGLKVGVTGPAGASAFIASPVGMWQNRTGTIYVDPIDLGATLNFQAPEARGMATLRAIVTTAGTAGNVRLQWAQEATSSTPTVLKAGSLILARKIF